MNVLLRNGILFQRPGLKQSRNCN